MQGEKAFFYFNFEIFGGILYIKRKLKFSAKKVKEKK